VLLNPLEAMLCYKQLGTVKQTFGRVRSSWPEIVADLVR
jgi:hypothetical protein